MVTVARSADEAARIARGEDVTIRRTEAEEEAAAATAAAEAMFEPEAAETRDPRKTDDDAGAKAAGTDAAEAPAKRARAKRKKSEDA